MVNVLKECDYHQSDERGKAKRKEEREKKQLKIRPQMTTICVYGCNAAICAHLCTGGAATLTSSCAVYNTEYAKAYFESMHNREHK